MGELTTNKYYYIPDYGDYGQDVWDEYNDSRGLLDQRLAYQKMVGDKYFDDATGATWEAKLINALNVLGATPAVLVIPPEQITLTASLSIPSTVALFLIYGANFVIPAGYQLTIGGVVQAGKWQWITDQTAGLNGLVLNGPQDYICPEWWGGSASANSATALNAAAICAGAKKSTVLLSLLYRADATWNIPADCNVKGIGRMGVGLDSRANGPAITGTGKWFEQVFEKFMITHANNANSGLIMLDAQYGALYSKFTDITLKGLSTATADGLVIRGNHPTAGANNNQYSNILENIRTMTLDSEISGTAIKLYGTGTVNTRCNNNVVKSCCPGGFATGIYACGQGNRITDPVFNDANSTAAIHLDSPSGGGCLLNVIDNPYFDAGLTGDKIRISNEVNSANINIVDIRSTMLAITEYDVIRDGSHPEHAVFKLNGIYYKGGTPGAFITSVGTNFRDLLNGDTYVKLGYGGVTPALWLAETVYSLNDVVRPNISLPPGTGPNGKFYVCTSAGTSGSSQPTWGTTNGGTTADDGATWTCYPEWSACDSWVGSTSVDPPSVNAGAEATFTITTGAFFPAACFAEVNPVALTAGLFVRRAYVSDVGVITVVLRNETGSPIDDAAGFWRWKVSRFI